MRCSVLTVGCDPQCPTAMHCLLSYCTVSTILLHSSGEISIVLVLQFYSLLRLQDGYGWNNCNTISKNLIPKRQTVQNFAIIANPVTSLFIEGPLWLFGLFFQIFRKKAHKRFMWGMGLIWQCIMATINICGPKIPRENIDNILEQNIHVGNRYVRAMGVVWPNSDGY